MKIASIAAAALLSVLSSAAASVLGTEIQAIGPWHIHKNQDAMTDAVSCLATYEDNLDVQLTNESFSIGLRGRGGVSGYTLRVDDLPPGSTKVASKIEKKVGAAYITGEQFHALLQAKRVRFQALTALSSLVNEDIDFSQVQPVMDVLNGPDCKR